MTLAETAAAEYSGYFRRKVDFTVGFNEGLRAAVLLADQYGATLLAKAIEKEIQ